MYSKTEFILQYQLYFYTIRRDNRKKNQNRIYFQKEGTDYFPMVIKLKENKEKENVPSYTAF